MKRMFVAISAMALMLSAQGQMRGGMSARPTGTTRLPVAGSSMPRPIPRPSSGFIVPPRFPAARTAPAPAPAPAPLASRHHGIIVSSVPFGSFFDQGFFFNGFFIPRGFFRSPFCFQNPFFCRKLFLHAFFGFGGLNDFPVVTFPLVAPGASLVTDPPPADTSAMQQEGDAVAELQRDLYEERLHREQLEQQVADLNSPKVIEVQPQKELEAEASPLPTVLVFRNGTRTEIQNYAIVGKALYTFAPHRTKKILISDLNVPATISANEKRGVEFHMPPRGVVVTHP